MKKILILFIGILCLFGCEEKIQGSGTLEDPYIATNVEKIKELENIFVSEYPALLQNSPLKFHDETDRLWTTNTILEQSPVTIKSIHFIGTQMQSDYLTLYASGAISNNLKEDIVARFKEEEIMYSTGDTSFDIDLTMELEGASFDSSNSDRFSEKLAQDILDEHAKMIITYLVYDGADWYQLVSMIDIENPTYLKIPNL